VDLTLPLSTIAPSLESAALDVLAGTESGLSASAVSRLSPRGTRQGLMKVLAKLVTHGLVVTDPSSTGVLYRLNRDHVLAPAVLTAVTARREVVTRLANGIAEIAEVAPVICAAVYGSFARRDATVDSDVDVLLVIDDATDVDDDRWTTALLALEDRFLLWTGNRLEPLVMTQQGLHRAVRKREPIVEAWRDDAITIHGHDLNELLAEAPRTRAAR
jgi:predicted nucleotidyltransferase